MNKKRLSFEATIQSNHGRVWAMDTTNVEVDVEILNSYVI